MINVTKTFLPPQKEYNDILKRAWNKAWITNRGELVNELEDRLEEYLGTPNVLLMTNGTLPIQIAIKGLGLTGEIITTPFSYVATTSSIVWEGCTPVFVDIDSEFLTIDEKQIENAISEKTSAILATHVFGNPCNIEKINEICTKYDLKVIYDAAHCFGVKYNGQSIFNYGDISTCSFHATKLFHTGEGGGLFCQSDLRKLMFDHHNFGHDGPGVFSCVGINAKMSEIQAAMGLAVLPYIEEIIKEREKRVEIYNDAISIGRSFKIRPGTQWNSSYYPIIFDSEKALLKTVEELLKAKINPRRYFYPSLNLLPYVAKSSMPVSESIASRILCLPLYHDLLLEEQSKIIDVVNN